MQAMHGRRHNKKTYGFNHCLPGQTVAQVACGRQNFSLITKIMYTQNAHDKGWTAAVFIVALSVSIIHLNYGHLSHEIFHIFLLWILFHHHNMCVWWTALNFVCTGYTNVCIEVRHTRRSATSRFIVCGIYYLSMWNCGFLSCVHLCVLWCRYGYVWYIWASLYVHSNLVCR